MRQALTYAVCAAAIVTRMGAVAIRNTCPEPQRQQPTLQQTDKAVGEKRRWRQAKVVLVAHD